MPPLPPELHFAYKGKSTIVVDAYPGDPLRVNLRNDLPGELKLEAGSIIGMGADCEVVYGGTFTLEKPESETEAEAA